MDPSPSERPVRNGPPTVREPERHQTEMRMASLDDLLPVEHQARIVWEYVSRLDLSELYAQVKSGGGIGGRSALSPRAMLSLWLYAVLDGISSARHLSELCVEHIAYQWLCGGLKPNPHSLSDFRVDHERLLDRLLTESVARLRHTGLVTMELVAQDGMRVRANAGADSFHRIETLEAMRGEAQQQVAMLKAEAARDPSASRTRKQAAQERGARERLERIEAALAVAESEAAKGEKPREKVRASSTDPQARVMKMPDGGFRPAYNVQFATDAGSQVIVGVDAVNAGSDQGQASRMCGQLDERYAAQPQTLLIDGGFTALAEIERLDAAGVTPVGPVPKPKDDKRNRYSPFPDDSPAVAAWRVRMGQDATRILYHLRAATAECVNAIARNRGLRQFTVRGTDAVRTVATWYAIAHNVLRLAILMSVPVKA